jgi:hypothetical protein
LLFALATAAVLGVAAPASAQGVYVGVGGYYGSWWDGPYRYHHRFHRTWQGQGWAYSGSPHYGYYSYNDWGGGY